jgi:hypothetical protein
VTVYIINIDLNRGKVGLSMIKDSNNSWLNL